MSGVRIAVVVLLIAGLTACAAPSNKPPTSQQDAPGANVTQVKPTAKPSATPTADPNVMFTITGTVHSADGATADLKQVVYRPIAQSEDAASFALFSDPEYLCGDPADIPGAMLLKAVVTVTDTSPAGSSWPDDAYGLTFLASGGRTRYAGSWNNAGSPCDTPAYVVLGETQTVSLANPTYADEVYGWASHDYGFIADPSEYGGTIGVTITNCAIEISDWALANSASTHNWPSQSHDSASCLFGEDLYGIY